MPLSTTDPRAALVGVYRTPDILFVRGEGSELVDEEGRRYLDFTSGIGVNALGHGHPVIVGAIRSALETGLIHASNLFRTAPAEELARLLTRLSGLDRAFFCNSGAESVEGALKFAKKWAKLRGGEDKFRIVAFSRSFHGRLWGSLAVTDRPDYRRPFEPLMPGAVFVDPMDLAAVSAALDPATTAAVILEPIQGEGGIRLLSDDLLRTVREWTRERGIALILDEIQCGLGRTGTLFAHLPSGIRPDILCLAKPLGGGLPMGAVLTTEEIAEAMSPGDHGTTFGGGALVSRVAIAVVEAVSRPEFLAEVTRKGARLGALLEELRAAHPAAVREIRGRGLIWGIELSDPAGPVVARARESGLLTVPAGTHVVRLLPPLTVSVAEIERAVAILGDSLAQG
jgi:predicted acetylornithine/succinylornithine family transaminase